MKKIALLFFSILYFCTSIFAQDDIQYSNPSSIQHSLYTIEIKDLVSKEDYCKFKLTLINKSEKYLAINRSKIGFHYVNLGQKFFPLKDKNLIVAPGKKVSLTVKSSKKIYYLRNYFSIIIGGLSYASKEEIIALDKINLVEGQTINSDGLSLSVNKTVLKKGKFSFSIKGEYNGASNEFITFDKDLLTVEDNSQKTLAPSINLPLKFKILTIKSLPFFIKGTFPATTNNNFILSNQAIKKYELSPLLPKDVNIHREGYRPQKACGPVTYNSGAKTKVTFLNSGSECFRLFVDGVSMGRDYGRSVAFNTN